MIERRRRGAWLFLGVIGLTVGTAGPAEAQSGPNAAAAQALFDQAVDLMNAKNYAAACPKLEEAVRLEPGAVGAKVQLAQCYEGSGRKASAWSAWGEAAAQAEKLGQADRAATANGRLNALKPQLATLTISVPSNVAAASGLQIRKDGVEVGRGQWESPVPIDAGAHRITVSAAGQPEWAKNLQVTDGTSQSLVIPPPGSGSGDGAASSERKWQLPLGISLASIGAVGLAVGGVFGGLSLSSKNASNAKGLCSASDHCTQEGFDDRTHAITFGNVSTALFVAGGVLAGTGLIITLTAPGVTSKKPTVGLMVGPGQLGLQGGF